MTIIYLAVTASFHRHYNFVCVIDMIMIDYPKLSKMKSYVILTSLIVLVLISLNSLQSGKSFSGSRMNGHEIIIPAKKATTFLLNKSNSSDCNDESVDDNGDSYYSTENFLSGKNISFCKIYM